MHDKIKCYIAAGEGDRAKKLALAIAEDPRFEPLEVNAEIPVDVMFSISVPADDSSIHIHRGKEYADEWKTKHFMTELKECPDYVSSALGKDGHLFMQHLTMREAGHTAMILVLGGDAQVNDAIYHSLKTQYHGDELKFNMESYRKRLQDFESKSFAMGVPVMRWQISPFERLLSTAHKVLTESNLMDYSPRPIDNEREIVASSILYRGIGPDTIKNLLMDYDLCFVPKPGARDVKDIPGFGPKRAALIKSRIVRRLK